ncbi:hypothetical protein A3Q34_16945 [Colwellia sp. PAMC 20917]|uniref:hypothetical protein n=1 Tax=Colwellia sp. PAMC 20917 TaxID=1816218 RepID=UPI000878DB1B|nr:hypothetical protein [Colwellia sp. PAMC 20917]AOW77219.1 hypothetical protein A3Q34_10375 [Colwellia sp. PAMC 20917]AOW78380.1 hypothetical protein A3Q34_16945 [Colwellia sp. PAMC 20917]
MDLWKEMYLLKHSEPQFVFDSLEKNRRKKINIMDEDRSKLEEMLLERNDPIIDLALALHGSTPDIGYELFKRPDKELQLATLSGTQVLKEFLGKDDFADRVLNDLIEKDDTELYRAYFSNDLLPDEIIISLYEREEPFDKLDDRDWVLCCSYTDKNKRISTPYDRTWIDGFDEYLYNSLFHAGWKLFEKFPKTPLAANVLSQLACKLVTQTPHDFNIIDALNRWQKETDTDSDAYDMARSYGANMITDSREFQELKKSDDFALRKAYYRNQKWVKPEDVLEGFEKDSINYIDEALNNMNIFSNAEAREALRKVCWDAPDPGSRMDQVNYFNGRSEYWQSQHPEWFKDEWTGELPFEEIENQNDRIEKRIEHLSDGLNKLNKKLSVEDDSDYENEREVSITHYLKSEMEAIAQLLVQIHRKVHSGFIYGVIGIAIGYFIARY